MDRTERLLNLVLCLLSASSPVDRETIRRIVAGYDTSASDASFERMFERDKDELRSMGIPLDTVTTPEGEVLGYRILRDDYRLPPIEATAEQWALLGLAGRAWSQASMGHQARSALRKLEAISTPATSHPLGEIIEWRARPEAGEQWLATLWKAIRQRHTISLRYQGLRDDVPRMRNLQPWRVLGRQGGWYLVGFDLERQAPRSFRLSRIIGDITVEGEPGAYLIPDHDVDQIMRVDSLDGDLVTAWIAVEPGAGGGVRMSSGAPTTLPEDIVERTPLGFDVLRVDTHDELALVMDIAELGEHGRILHPEALQQAVTERWSAVLAAHESEMSDQWGVDPEPQPETDRAGTDAFVVRGERLGRLLALVPWLSQHPGVTITEAAEHFGVTAEQLETDLWLVVCCGLPGHGPDQLIDIQFWDDDGTIDVIDPQALVAPTQLTVDEAVSLQLGLSMLAGVADAADATLVQQTMNLLTEATGGLEMTALDAVSTDTGADEGIRSVLLAACEDASAVRIEYYTATRDVVSTRIIRPERMVMGGGGRVLLEAWCAQARDARTFRVDRILSAQPVPTVDVPVDQQVDTPGASRVATGAPVEVHLHIRPSARWMWDAYDLQRVSPGSQADVVARLEVHDPRWLVRLVLGLGGEVSVLSPPEYRAMVANAARRALGDPSKRPRGDSTPAG